MQILLRSRPIALFLGLVTVSLWLAAAPSSADSQTDDTAPSKALLHEYCSGTRLAGTKGSVRSADFVTRVLEQAGWTVERDSREVLLSLPRKTTLEVYADGTATDPLYARIRSFDPDALPPGDVPPFNAWSATADVRGPVVDCGYGMQEDFASLADGRVNVSGCIALCRYGKGYRGSKLERAQAAGCIAVLFWTDPADSGEGRGATWPEGPWMPKWAVQRGTVASVVHAPGDPSTPGFASPRVGEEGGQARLSGPALDAALPKLPCLPISAEDAIALRAALRTKRVAQPDGSRVNVPRGPGPAIVRLAVDAPREVRTIHNVIARLPGQRAGYVLAGNHRDAWVRGASDAGGGTVGLLRAAQVLGEQYTNGWRPRHGIALAFWDAEEMGLIGSTEWCEAHARELPDDLIAYVNCDALVSGTQIRVSGTPGLEPVVSLALEKVPHPNGGTRPGGAPRSLVDSWLEGSEGLPRFALPGSGSDYAAFLHHLTLPVLDVQFTGNTGGHYHTSIDDVLMVERFLDPGYVGHELAGTFVAELLAEMSVHGRLCYDDESAAREYARHARDAKSWLGEERGERLAVAFETLSRTIAVDWAAWANRMKFKGGGDLGPFGTYPSFLTALDASELRIVLDALRHTSGRPRMLGALAATNGIEGRPWQRLSLWAPDAEDGYGTVFLPELRALVGAGADDAALEAGLTAWVSRINTLRSSWEFGR
jgi:N-acetylated-alpha-linked acidic dipeptidase